MKKGKIGYIFKKLFRVILIAIISIAIYQLFIGTKNLSNNNNNENYGTKLSAEEDTQEEISSQIELASNNIVGISKIKNVGSSAFLTNSTESLNLGTGVIVSKKGYILTNQHVAGGISEKCYVTSEAGKSYTGRIIWASEEIDLAIIKVEDTFIQAADLADSNSINIGEKVYAIGNPIGYEFQKTVTGGIISAVNRTVKVKNEDETYSYMSNLIQTDATINPGNSGGPLINEEGKVVGINTIKITSAEGIGFAIPINIIKPIIEKYEIYGNFKEAYLGIFAYDGSVISYLNEDINFSKGIYIEKIAEKSPASTTELESGDIITKVDNTSVNKVSELQEYIFKKNPEDEIILNIIRDNKEKQIKVILGEKNN